MARPPRSVHLDELDAIPGPGTLTWHPVRAHLGIRAFGCNACGPQPIRIWQYRDGKLRKATREFKGLVRADSRRARRGYLRNRHRGAEYAKSFLTPYTADLCLLGQCGKGLRTVRGAIRRGELSHRSDLDTPPYGNEFLAALRRLLRRYGYLP